MLTRRGFLKAVTLLPLVGWSQIAATPSSEIPEPPTQGKQSPPASLWYFAKQPGGDGMTFPAYFAKEPPRHKFHTLLTMRGG